MLLERNALRINTDTVTAIFHNILGSAYETSGDPKESQRAEIRSL